MAPASWVNADPQSPTYKARPCARCGHPQNRHASSMGPSDCGLCDSCSWFVEPGTDLPLDLLSITTPRGTVWHLVSVEEPRPVTLCGRATGVNPRHIYVGTYAAVGPSERADCKACIRAAHERGDL